MWINKNTNTYSDSAWPSNEYLKDWCNVSIRTVITCKKKCKELGMFNIIKLKDKTSIWILNDIPKVLIDEFETFKKEATK